MVRILLSVSDSASDNHAAASETAADPPRRKRGGQPGNMNTIQHGLYAAKPDRWVSRFGNKNCNLFRRHLTEAVVALYGELSTYHASLVQTASEAVRAAVGNRELMAKIEDPKPELRMALDREYMRHLCLRDAKLKELGLDGRAASDDEGRKGGNDVCLPGYMNDPATLL